MLIYYCIVAFSVFMSSLSQLLLKSSSVSEHKSVIKEYFNIKVIGGNGIMFLSLFLNIFALSKGIQIKELSTMESLSYLFVPILSYFSFKETISFRKCMSIGVIMLGVFVFFQ